MRIHNVTMTGFGPFKETASVDFDAFGDEMFLIAGRTGSGKTSVLDAVTFALFGSIPRFDTSPVVRSAYCAADDVTEVTCEFSAAGRRFRICRRPAYEVPKRRGEGMTTRPAHAELTEITASGEIGLAARAKDTAEAIEEIVGLNAVQFRQVILLAQGQFAEFLVASTDDRQRLLRKLFDSGRFVDHTEAVRARAKRLREQISGASQSATSLTETLVRLTGRPLPEGAGPDDLIAVSGWLDALLVDQDTAVAEALAGQVETGLRAEAARKELEALTAIRDLQKRRDDAVGRMAELDAMAEAVATRRITLDAAERAMRVRSPLQAHRRVTAQLSQATARLVTASEDFAALVGREPTGDLGEVVEELDTALGALAGAEEAEQRLAQWRYLADAADLKVGVWEQEFTRRTEIRDQLADQLGRLSERIAAARPVVDTLPEVVEAVRTATTVRDAAAAEAAANAERADLLQQRVEANTTLARAATDVADLQRRQLDGSAGRLAAELVDGQPCGVCGALEHPAPAPSTDPVSDADISAADALRLRAAEALDAVNCRIASVETRLAAATAASGGVTSADAEITLAAARADQDRLTSLRAEITTAEADLDRTTRDLAAAEVSIQGHLTKKDDLISGRASAGQQVSAAEDLIALSLGGFGTVAAHVAHLRAERTATAAVRDADREVRSVGASESVRRTELAAALSTSGFDTPEQVDAAQLDDTVRRSMDQALRRHDTDRAATAKILSSAELADLPDEAVDVGAAMVAYEEAKDAAGTARDACAAATSAREHWQVQADAIRGHIGEITRIGADFEMVQRLAATLNGEAPNTKKMDLEAFVLAGALEEILVCANQRLSSMTNGRFTLVHDIRKGGRGAAGLEILVDDLFTGTPRRPESLSGGEKFQASLALALGLADHVTAANGGIRLDSLFIDEGFGSLDAETLETTMSTLDDLRQGGRTIGLISHVEAMKEQIPAKVLVEVTAGGWSTTHQECASQQ